MKLNRNFAKGIKSTLKGKDVSDREELKNMIYKMIEKSLLYNKLKDPDVYDDKGTKIYLKELLEVTEHLLNISEAFIVDKLFITNMKKLTELNNDREKLNEEISHINNKINEKINFIESESNTNEEEKENVKREIKELEKHRDSKTNKNNKNTEYIKEITEKVLSRIENIKKNSEDECRELMFLKNLVNEKDIDFDLEDIKNLAYHLYRSGNALNMKSVIQNWNAAFGQKNNILEVCEKYFSAGKLVTSDYFDKMYDFLFNGNNIDLSEYDDKIDGLITQDIAYSERKIKNIEFNEDNTVSLQMSIPHYWSLLKSMELIKNMKDTPSENEKRLLEFREMLNMSENKENNNVPANEETENKETFVKLEVDDIGEEIVINSDNKNLKEAESANMEEEVKETVKEEQEIFEHEDKRKTLLIKRIESYKLKPSKVSLKLISDFIEKNLYLLNDNDIKNLLSDENYPEFNSLFEKYGDV